MTHDAGLPRLQPCLKELLRTCVHPSSLLLQVERFESIDNQQDVDDTSLHSGLIENKPFNDSHRYATKLFLTDGELVVQALLHRKLVALPGAGDVEVGDYVELRSFQVKKAKKLKGYGDTLFLGIDDCHFINKNRPEFKSESHVSSETLKTRKRVASEEVDDNNTKIHETDGALNTISRSHTTSLSKRLRISPPFVDGTSDGYNAEIPEKERHSPHMPVQNSPQSEDSEELKGQFLKESTDQQETVQTELKSKGRQIARGEQSCARGEDDEEDFESAAVDAQEIEERRQTLRQFESNLTVSSTTSHSNETMLNVHNENEAVRKWEDDIPAADSHNLQNHNEEALQPARNACQPPAGEQIQAPSSKAVNNTALIPLNPAFHCLQSLRSPPVHQPLPSRSYSLATLAFITWVGSSLIHRPGSPFPPKRHLKIEDPSVYSPTNAALPSERGNPSTNAAEPKAFNGQPEFQGSVTLAVYVDAANFKPKAGKLALFRGIVMQKLTSGDIILNAYAKLKDQRFVDALPTVNEKLETAYQRQGKPEATMSPPGEWYIDDLDKIRRLGYAKKVEEYQAWWNERYQLKRNEAM